MIASYTGMKLYKICSRGSIDARHPSRRADDDPARAV